VLLQTSLLKLPLIAQTVEAIVNGQGGSVEYDQGAGGREVLIAASARLAASAGAPLTVVEFPALHDDITATVAELQPTVAVTVLSAREAAERAEHTGGVLAIHADVLRETDVRHPLLELARAADHLVVARHAYSDTTLDALTGPAHPLKADQLLRAAPPHALHTVPRTAETATRLAAHIYALDQDIASAPPSQALAMQVRREGMLESEEARFHSTPPRGLHPHAPEQSTAPPAASSPGDE
jgi:hypothetical protein